MIKMKKQAGFALIEVMLAALVMTIGGVAFMRLQQIGLKYNFNNYARTQGVLLVGDFVEKMRTNIDFIKTSKLSGAIINGEINKSQKFPKVPNCNSSSSVASCSKSVFELQKYFISADMKKIASNNILCYMEQSAGNGYIRVTYLWEDNSNNKSHNALQCPKTFDEEKNGNNSVTIYAQL